MKRTQAGVDSTGFAFVEHYREIKDASYLRSEPQPPQQTLELPSAARSSLTIGIAPTPDVRLDPVAEGFTYPVGEVRPAPAGFKEAPARGSSAVSR